MPSNSRRSAALLLTSVGALCALPACGQRRADPTLSAIRSNPTVNLETTSKRGEDQGNNWASTSDIYARQLPTDIARALYIDRPHRLHKAPSPY